MTVDELEAGTVTYMEEEDVAKRNFDQGKALGGKEVDTNFLQTKMKLELLLEYELAVALYFDCLSLGWSQAVGAGEGPGEGGQEGDGSGRTVVVVDSTFPMVRTRSSSV